MEIKLKNAKVRVFSGAKKELLKEEKITLKGNVQIKHLRKTVNDALALAKLGVNKTCYITVAYKNGNENATYSYLAEVKKPAKVTKKKVVKKPAKATKKKPAPKKEIKTI